MTPKELFMSATVLKEVPGIYIIYCLADEKCYIGSASNAVFRRRTHISYLKKNKHHCKNLQSAWNKYGRENFIFRLLEEIEKPTPTILIDLENKYLLQLERKQLFNSIVPAVLGGTGEFCLKKEEHPQSKVKQETIDAIKLDYLQYKGKKATNYRQKLAQKYNLSTSLVGSICIGKHWSNPDYKWKNAGANSRLNVLGGNKQKPGASEDIKIPKEICEQIYNEWKEERENSLGDRVVIPGLNKRLAKKYGLHPTSITKICSGKHIYSPVHDKQEHKIEGFSKISDELALGISLRYNEILKEKGLPKVKGMKEMLAKEFNTTIPMILRAYHFKRKNNL